MANVADYKAIRLALHRDKNGIIDFSEPGSGQNDITIPYGGNITLVVSTLDYSPGSLQRFMYKIAESRTDTVGGWVVMPESSSDLFALKDPLAKFSTTTNFGMVIHNFAEKPMMAVRIKMYPFDTENFNEEVVKINRIDKNSSVQIESHALACLYSHIPHKFLPQMKRLNEALPARIEVSLYTERYERIRKFYRIDSKYDKRVPNIVNKIESNMQIRYFQ